MEKLNYTAADRLNILLRKSEEPHSNILNNNFI